MDQAYQHFSIPVTPDFESVFSHFYFAENTGDTAITKTLLPSYQTILVFIFGGKAVLHSRQDTQLDIDQCIVLGPIRQAFDYTLVPGIRMLVANFKDDAFFRFFGNAAPEKETPQHPDQLLEDNCFTHLWAALGQIDQPARQVAYILEFCRPYLQQQHPLSEKLAGFRNDNLNPIKAIAGATGQSERNIQLHHKKQFGYTAKERLRYQRFMKAIQHLQQQLASGRTADWFELIDACGYYDQSQLIHDFKHYLHLSPTQYIKFQEDICVSQH